LDSIRKHTAIMKKILLLFSLIFVFALSQGQYAGFVADNNAPSSGYSAEYQVIYDRKDVLGTPPDATNAGYQETMVNALVDGGYWVKFDLFYVFANQYETSSLMNWISHDGTYDCTETEVGSLTYTQYQGYTGDGTNYLLTGYNPNTNKINISLDDVALGYYVRLDRDANEYNMGAYDESTALTISGSYGNEYMYSNLHDNITFQSSVTGGDGFFTSSRRGHTENESYRNATTVATSTHESEAIPNSELQILANGLGSGISQNQIAIAFVSSKLTDDDVTAINTILEAYMDGIGMGVQ